ncbi:hypothetical protein [Mycetocola sp. 2940]|uniref:hypothetical protein n=1 Tax=Mycetocola sp. 2940 TaxID=3156452 RepID=UPI003392B49E
MTTTSAAPRKLPRPSLFALRPSWLSLDSVAILLLVLLSSAFVISEVPANPAFSPFDEYVYADYLDKVPSQLVVRAGDETGELARNELSCRGVRFFETIGESCNAGTHDRDELYPYAGTTAADIYAPVYFVATWTLAQPLVATGVGLVDAGRLVGVLWLSLGLSLLFILLRRLRVDKVLALASALLVFAAPVSFWNSTYLSTDAPTLALSAAMGILAVDAIRGRRSVWWLVPVAIVAVLTKVQNLGSVALVALAILIAAVHPAVRDVVRADHDQPDDLTVRSPAGPRLSMVLAACAIAGVALVTQVAWLAVRAFLRAPGYVATPIDFNNPDLTPAAILGEAFRFLLNVGDAGVDHDLVDAVTVTVLTAVCITGTLGLALSSSATGVGPVRRWLVGVPTLVTALIFGPMLAIGSHVIAGYYFELPTRYGVVLLPFLVCCAAVYFTRVPWIRFPALALGGILALATFL